MPSDEGASECASRLVLSGCGLNSATSRSTTSSNVLSDFMPMAKNGIDASTINDKPIVIEHAFARFGESFFECIKTRQVLHDHNTVAE